MAPWLESLGWVKGFCTDTHPASSSQEMGACTAAAPRLSQLEVALPPPALCCLLPSTPRTLPSCP